MSKYTPDESKYQINPALTSKIMDTKGINYGTAVSKMFDDLGKIELQKEDREQKQEDRDLTRQSTLLNIDNAKKEQEIKEISINDLRGKLEDKNTFSSLVTSDNPTETMNSVKFNDPNMYTLANDYITKDKNNLSLEEQKKHFGIASSKFTDDKGNFDRSGAIGYLNEKYKNGEIKEQTFADVVDAINKQSGLGIYKPVVSAKDQLSMLVSQAKIAESNAKINKINYEIKNGNDDKNPLKKELALFNEQIKAGVIPPDTQFGSWLSETGGKVNLKSESTSTAKNKLTVQFDGINKLSELIKNYDDSQAGIFQGGGQALQELTGIHSEKSAKLESQRNGIAMSLTKALAGGNPSNADRARVESIIGGAWQTESGTAGKYKSALDQAIISVDETIQQLENAGYKATKERAKLNEYQAFRNAIDKWDGDVSINEYLGKQNNKQNTFISPDTILETKSSQPQTAINKPSWRYYEK